MGTQCDFNNNSALQPRAQCTLVSCNRQTGCSVASRPVNVQAGVRLPSAGPVAIRFKSRGHGCDQVTEVTALITWFRDGALVGPD